MLAAIKNRLASELSSLISTNLSSKEPTIEELTKLVDNFFLQKSIKSFDDKSNIIKRALLSSHPDKVTNPTRASLITQILNSIREGLNLLKESQIKSSPDKAQPEFRNSVFFDCEKMLVGSVFNNSETESRIRDLCVSYEPIRNWIKPQSTTTPSAMNVVVKFIKIIWKRDNLILQPDELVKMLTKTALIEIIANNAQPELPMHNVIEKYIDEASNLAKHHKYPILFDCLLWLIQEIALDYDECAQRKDNELYATNTNTPNLVQIMSTLQIFEEYKDTESLRALLNNWSSDQYLPHVKALLEARLKLYSNSISMESNSYEGRLVMDDKVAVFRINEKSKKMLATLLQLDDLSLDKQLVDAYLNVSPKSSKLKNLENHRHILIREIKRLPSDLFSAKYQLMNSGVGGPISAGTIGEFLSNRLSLLNYMINQERQNQYHIAEDSSFQPKLVLLDKYIENFPACNGVIIPYFHAISLKNHEESTVEDKLMIDDEWIPKYINPEITTIIQKTMSGAGIRCRLNSSYYFWQPSKNGYCVNDAFSNCSEKLKQCIESRKLLLIVSCEIFEKINLNFNNEFRNCVISHIGINSSDDSRLSNVI